MSTSTITQFLAAFGQIVTCGGVKQQACTLNDFFVLAQNVIYFFGGPALVFAAIVSITIAGIKYIHYGYGSAGEKDKAKVILQEVLIGIALVLGSFLLVKVIIGFFAKPEYLPF